MDTTELFAAVARIDERTEILTANQAELMLKFDRHTAEQTLMRDRLVIVEHELRGIVATKGRFWDGAFKLLVGLLLGYLLYHFGLK